MRYEGDYFRIRELHSADAESLFSRYSGCIESAKYISSLPHETVEVTRSAITKWQSYYFDTDPNLLVYGIASKLDDTIFGLLVLVLNGPMGEIHFGLSQDFSGKGIATSVCKAGLLELKRRGIKEVRTAPYIGHLASVKVLEKCGFRSYGTLFKHAPFPSLGDGLFDCLDFRLHF